MEKRRWIHSESVGSGLLGEIDCCRIVNRQSSVKRHGIQVVIFGVRLFLVLNYIQSTFSYCFIENIQSLWSGKAGWGRLRDIRIPSCLAGTWECIPPIRNKGKPSRYGQWIQRPETEPGPLEHGRKFEHLKKALDFKFKTEISDWDETLTKIKVFS